MTKKCFKIYPSLKSFISLKDKNFNTPDVSLRNIMSADSVNTANITNIDDN